MTRTTGQRVYAAMRCLNEAKTHLEGVWLDGETHIDGLINRIVIACMKSESLEECYTALPALRGIPNVALGCVFELATTNTFPLAEDAMTVMGLNQNGPKLFTVGESERFLRRAMMATGCVDSENLSPKTIDWIVERSGRNPARLKGRSYKAALQWITTSTTNATLAQVAAEIGEAASRSGYRELYERELEKERAINNVHGYSKLAQKHVSKMNNLNPDYDTYKSDKLPDSTLAHFARRTVTRRVIEDVWMHVRQGAHVSH